MLHFALGDSPTVLLTPCVLLIRLVDPAKEILLDFGHSDVHSVGGKDDLVLVSCPFVLFV